MSDFKFKNEPNVNIEELLYKIKILEERLVQKDELITILKEYNERFINHSEKLASVLDKQQGNGLSERDQFLLKKAAQIFSKSNPENNYEEHTINRIKHSVSKEDTLSSFSVASDSISSASREIEFYQSSYDSENIQDDGISDPSLRTKNPFQKTIDRIKTSEPKTLDDVQPLHTPINPMTESRGDELDDSINKTLNSQNSAKPIGRIKIR